MNPHHLAKSLIALITFATIQPITASQRQVRFLAWDETVADRSVAVIGGGKPIEVENLHPLQRSDAVRATATENRLDLIALDHEDPGSTVFSVALPGDSGPLLVLLLPDPETPSGLRGFALVDSLVSFPWGAFRMVNATDRPVIMRLGGVVKTLPSGFKPVDFDAPPPGNHPVVLAAREEPDQPVYSSVWSADTDTRRLIFVMPGDEVRLGRVALKVIPEFRPAAEE